MFDFPPEKELLKGGGHGDRADRDRDREEEESIEMMVMLLKAVSVVEDGEERWREEEERR